MKKSFLLIALLTSLTLAALATPPNKELFVAVMKNNAPQVETLLAAGADPNSPIEVVPGFPTTYLITAAGNGSLEVVKALLKHKAQVNQPDAFKSTALMAAAGKGNKAVVELLLGSGADAKAKDDDGKDALAAAKESGNAEVIKLIEAKLK
ncbi:Ankyrin repeat-containing protein [Hymenobacter daecheongensis DSM 21074]|uniref:Ankyrin repeat-containing protein n=1 Tax=Hymenobacter daecheongensis DSM 21074 TaxID=1121955 RepID=A0A1M6I091_9BACT|nr:ankyrin repeat domain-containing protein [Hymenobacter daecheongensis]SHJ27825.1 Ankyrin repeat-containing protein [Hymenobacter daecheongensis DSM 21074]